jgi:hypothetical protein
MTGKAKIAVACGTAVAGVVVAFVVAHMLFVGLSWWPLGKPKTPFTSTGLKLKSLHFTISAYKEDEGRYPRSLGELRQHLEMEGPEGQRSPMFCDAWGQELVYVPENARFNQGAFDLYSVGPNGKDEYDVAGFGDDIHVRSDGMVQFPKHHRQ